MNEGDKVIVFLPHFFNLGNGTESWEWVNPFQGAEPGVKHQTDFRAGTLHSAFC